jgi:hypothetical protein
VHDEFCIQFVHPTDLPLFTSWGFLDCGSRHVQFAWGELGLSKPVWALRLARASWTSFRLLVGWTLMELTCGPEGMAGLFDGFMGWACLRGRRHRWSEIFLKKKIKK